MPLDKAFLGFSTKHLLNRRLENGHIGQQQSMKYLTGAQAFDQSALEYVIKEMNMRETPWVHASWMHFFRRDSSSWGDVLYFAEKLKSILQLDEQEKNLLYYQFIDFKMLDVSELQENTLSEAIFAEYDDGTKK